MRIFGWVRNLFGQPVAQTWDSDMPDPVSLIESTRKRLRDEDERTLDKLKEAYPLPDETPDKE